MPTAELAGIGYPNGATAEHRPTGHPTGLTHARGDAMFRHQFHAQVKLGKFRDFYATFNLWRELSQFVDGTPWDELWETAVQIA